MIYVVMGSCGEYSDYHTWPVAAFKEQDLANVFATKATEWAFKYYEEIIKEDDYHDRDEKGPFDIQFLDTWSPTTYNYIAVPILTSVPETE